MTKTNTENQRRCPYCGSELIRRPYHEISRSNNILYQSYQTSMVLCCTRFPECNSYVFIDDRISLGIPANPFLRKLRTRAHTVFDIIHLTQIRNITKLYNELGEAIHRYGDNAHIRFLDVYGCIECILFAIEYLNQSYHKVRTLKQLNDEQINLFTEISNLSIDLSNTEYTDEELSEIVRIIYDTNDFKLKKLSRRTCTANFVRLRKNGKFKSYEPYLFNKHGTLKQCVYSLTEHMYNAYAREHGYEVIQPHK